MSAAPLTREELLQLAEVAFGREVQFEFHCPEDFVFVDVGDRRYFLKDDEWVSWYNPLNQYWRAHQHRFRPLHRKFQDAGLNIHRDGSGYTLMTKCPGRSTPENEWVEQPLSVDLLGDGDVWDVLTLAQLETVDPSIFAEVIAPAQREWQATNLQIKQAEQDRQRAEQLVKNAEQAAKHEQAKQDRQWVRARMGAT